MTRNQRLGFLAIAAVIAVVAIVIFASGSGPDETAEDADNTAQQTATPTSTADQPEASPQETETPTPTPTPRPKPPLLTADDPRTIRFTEGETVRFRARSDTADHIHVHGYDLMKDVPAGETVTMSFKGSITGIFEIELEDAHVPLGELRVDPK
jgi:hypothetical protein